MGKTIDVAIRVKGKSASYLKKIHNAVDNTASKEITRV
jgi:hypothetical protein